VLGKPDLYAGLTQTNAKGPEVILGAFCVWGDFLERIAFKTGKPSGMLRIALEQPNPIKRDTL
jgi:hypothetical protein